MGRKYHLQKTVGLLKKKRQCMGGAKMSKNFTSVGEIKIHPHKNTEFITSRPELK